MKAIELFQLNIQRAEELLEVHKNSYPRGRPDSKGPAADILRAVVVFAVAAFDAYMHKRIIEVVKEILFYKKRVPQKCVEMIENSFKEKDGYKELLTWAIQKDPEAKILHQLQQCLSPLTFQKPDHLERAFKMMEVRDVWLRLRQSLRLRPGRRNRGRSPEVKTMLLSLAERRDDIVHEADMYISNKYHGKIKSISRVQTRRDLQQLKKIVLSIEKISKISIT